MFKQTLAGSAVLAVAQAIAFNSQKESSALGLAQTGLSHIEAAHEESDCCCSVMPCMPTCGSPCGGSTQKWTEPTPETPEPIRNIELNLDVILTHILHQVNPPELPPTPAAEHELIENVITPVVIQLMNNDIVPAIPVCTWPDGTEAEDWGINADGTLGEKAEPQTVMPDSSDVIEEVLHEVLDTLDLPDEIDQDKLIQDSLPSDEVVSEINLTSEDGLEEVSAIVSGLEQTVHNLLDGEEVDSSEIPDSVTALSDNLQ